MMMEFILMLLNGNREVLELVCTKILSMKKGNSYLWGIEETNNLGE